MNELTHAEFETKLQGNQAFVVDFYADWCQACQEMLPVVEELAQEFPNLEFYKVNVDLEPELKAQNKIKAIPMLLMFKDGRVREFAYGKVDKAKIANKLSRL